ncbi:PDR/VanB family oxidoreductase [Brevibacterium atlanticum]|uniref:PDR/VanB family oxidoreductase n=1 Tax=Brevibacterium atlanticum TaxID=2697563 RepID=UPI001420089B|nr:PDR/VanB family oxidoreductase [Brevibacterium atlanticum]
MNSPTALKTRANNIDVVELETTIADITDEADGVRSIEFVHAEGDELPPWEPGAHIDVLIGPDLERQYSLCGSTETPHSWRIAVLKEPESRGGSQWMHEELKVGDRIRIRGPRNNFSLVDADEYIFIAGGIGITPLLPMIAHCESNGKPWRLTYGGRSEASMAFIDTLALHGEKVEFWPQDRAGIIDLDTLLANPRDNVAVFCCGPGPLLDAVEKQCERWPKGTLHVERFRPSKNALSGENTAFEVELDESGQVIDVAADQSIVEALEAAGIHIPTSCREGTCGTCETVVLDGVPDHRDSFLTDQEKESNEVMMPCCSRAKCPRLVLDL